MDYEKLFETLVAEFISQGFKGNVAMSMARALVEVAATRFSDNKPRG